MIAILMKTRESALGPLNYNEGKINKGLAEALATRNIENDRLSIEMAFEKLRRGSRGGAKRISFQLMFCPGEKDNISDDQMLEIIDAVMYSIGMDKQPYVIYKHPTESHLNYRVVSTMINADGYRINDYRWYTIIMSELKNQSEKYDFTVGTRKNTAIKIIEDPKN